MLQRPRKALSRTFHLLLSFNSAFQASTQLSGGTKPNRGNIAFSASRPPRTTRTGRRKGRTNYERSAGGPRLRGRLYEATATEETSNRFATITICPTVAADTTLGAASTWPDASKVTAQ